MSVHLNNVTIEDLGYTVMSSNTAATFPNSNLGILLHTGSKYGPSEYSNQEQYFTLQTKQERSINCLLYG